MMPDNPQPTPRRRSFRKLIGRHWRGELGLGVSFWLMGLPLALFMAVMSAMVWQISLTARSPKTGLYAALTVIVLVYVGTVWQNVGIWRSAGRSMRERGKRVWPIIARVMVGISVCGAVINTLNEARNSWYDILMDMPSLPPSGVRILRDGTEIEITGPLRWGLVAQFQTALAKAPNARVVHLHSEGGLIGTGLEIRDLIAQRKMDTYVAVQCASACTIAFLAGEQRLIRDSARISFHQAHFHGQTSLLADLRLRDIYHAAGLTETFIDAAMETPPTRLWSPDASTLLADGIITGIVPFGRFAVSGFGPNPTVDSVGTVLMHIDTLRALATANPKGFTAVQQDWFGAVRTGGPGTIALASMQEQLLAAMRRALAQAPDAVIREYAIFAIDRHHARTGQMTGSCWDVARTGIASQLVPDLESREARLISYVLRETSASPVPLPDAVTQRHQRTLIATMARWLTPGQALTEERFCTIMPELLGRIVQLPLPQAGPLLRIALGNTVS